MATNPFFNAVAIVSRALQRVELAVGVLCLAAMLGIILTNVVFRYILFAPISWSDELSNYLFIWMGFLASAHVMGNDGHIRVTAVQDRLPRSARRLVHAAMNLVMIVVFWSYIGPTWRILPNLMRSNMLKVPLQWIYIIIPVSFAFMIIHVVNNALHDLRTRR